MIIYWLNQAQLRKNKSFPNKVATEKSSNFSCNYLPVSPLCRTIAMHCLPDRAGSLTQSILPPLLSSLSIPGSLGEGVGREERIQVGGVSSGVIGISESHNQDINIIGAACLSQLWHVYRSCWRGHWLSARSHCSGQRMLRSDWSSLCLRPNWTLITGVEPEL